MKKIFFGWFIVAASLLLMTYGSAMFVYGFTTFITPISLTFGWTYAQISFASSLHGIETGTMDPFVGMAADRWPARRLILIGIIIYALGAIWISQSTSLAMFYAGFLIVGLGSAVGTTMVPTTVIARWFRKNIGKANGILATGVALGGMFAPLLVKAIDAFTWQNTMLYLAIGALVLGIPLSFLFRDRPQDYGLLPDGKVHDDMNELSDADFGVGVKEAIKMRSFWYIAIAMMFQLIAMHAVTIHLMPHLTSPSVGMERSTAAVAVTIFSIVTIVSRIIYGFLADIFTKKYVMALSMGLTTIGLVIFQLLDGDSFSLVVIFAVVYGLGAAGVMPIRAPIIRDYFGVKNFGTIYGLLFVFIMFGSITGAPIAGWVYDTRGVYSPIWFIYAGLSMVGTILCLIMPPVSRNLGPVAGQGASLRGTGENGRELKSKNA